MAYQDGPWSKYQTAPAPSPPLPPSVIQGAPKQLDPGEAARLELARNADARAAEANARANAAAERAAAAAEKQNVSLTENQGKAAGFYISARGAENEWKTLEADPELKAGTQPAGILGDAARAVLPANVVNSNTSAARQRAQQAKENFIRASLRLESGAAIGASEFARQDRIFYPQTGDSPETIAQKARARQQVIDGFKIQAGPGADRAETMAAAEDNSPLEVRFNDEGKPATGYRLDTQQQQEIAAAIKSGDEGQTLALLQRFSGNPPTQATIDSVRANIANAKRDPNWSPDFNYGAVDAAAQSAADKEKFGDYLPAAIKAREGQVIDPYVRAIADVVPFSDEIAAAGNTLLGGGTYADNIRRERAIDEADARVNPNIRIAGQLTGAALPVGRFLGFGRTPGLARSALSYGAEGAVLGGLYAAGKADPSPTAPLSVALTERLSAAPTGAALGGASAYGLAALGNAIRNRPGNGGPPPGGQDALDIAQAAADENIPISRPILDPSRRDAMSYLESSIGGSGPVQRSLNATQEGIESRVQALGGAGTAQDEFTIGTAMQDAGRRYIKRSATVKERLYDRAAQIAGDAKVTPTEAVKRLDEEIAQLSRNPNQNDAEIRFLQKYRADLVDDNGNPVPKTVQEIRDMRTNLRGNITQNQLTASQAESRVLGALDAAKQDIQRDLTATNPAAVRAYDRADKFYRERQAEIKGVVQRVLGRSRQQSDQLTPEKAWANLRTMATTRGDSGALDRLWKKLEPQEQADAAASLAETFGSTPGELLAGTKNLSGRALETVFGPEGAKSIKNLRTLSRAYLDTTKKLNNSRSGQVLQWGNFLRNFVPSTAAGGLGGAAVGGPVGAAVGAGLMATGGVGLRNISARMLMSPDMSRWLANAPRQTTPQAISRYVTEGLSAVARRDPAIAQDVLGLQQRLQQAFSQTPSRAAASDEEKQ